MARKIKKVMNKDAYMAKKCRCMSAGMLILGALILVNVYWNILSWSAFIGWALVLAGLWKLIAHKRCV